MKLTLDIAQWNADITETHRYRREADVVISWYNARSDVVHQDASIDSSFLISRIIRYRCIIVHVIREAAFVMILA